MIFPTVMHRNANESPTVVRRVWAVRRLACPLGHSDNVGSTQCTTDTRLICSRSTTIFSMGGPWRAVGVSGQACITRYVKTRDYQPWSITRPLRARSLSADVAWINRNSPPEPSRMDLITMKLDVTYALHVKVGDVIVGEVNLNAPTRPVQPIAHGQTVHSISTDYERTGYPEIRFNFSTDPNSPAYSPWQKSSQLVMVVRDVFRNPLSDAAKAVIAGLVADGSTEEINKDGITADDSVWAEIRAAFPVALFREWANGNDDNYNEDAGY